MRHKNGSGAQVIKRGALDMQVCVPQHWDDDKVKSFADREYPCGTTTGWLVRKEGDKQLAGMPERVSCADRNGFVHIMLDA